MNKIWSAIVLPAVCIGSFSLLSVPVKAAEDPAKTVEAPAKTGEEPSKAAEEPAKEVTAPASGWQIENGKRYYYDAKGNKAVGNVEIEGITYVFAPNGVQQLGWQSVDDKRFYFDKNGEAKFGWIEWRGENYYVSRKNGKLTGEATTDEGEKLEFDEYGVRDKWQLVADGSWTYAEATGETEIDGKPYLFSDKGILLTGWQTAADGITRFYDAETHEILTGWVTAKNGVRSYADPETGRLTGWQTIEAKKYLFDAKGVLVTGLYTDEGKTYYFDADGLMQTGFIETTDGTRYFNKSGVMQTGMQPIDGNVYYFNESGIMQIGFRDLPAADGNTYRYLFNAQGIMQTGWHVVGDYRYYFTDDGIMMKEPVVLDGKTYLIDSLGHMVKGWYTAPDGSKYYANETGQAVTGLQTIGTDVYYFSIEGIMQIGFRDLTGADGNSYRYLFNAEGKMQTGWHVVGDYRYYFSASGIMARSLTVIDGKTYLFDQNGHTISGWYTAPNGSRYYGGTDGQALTGWQELPTQSSYFNANGVMAVSTTIDGYSIDANGSARSQRAITADKYIANSNKTVNGVYQSFYTPNYYASMETARTTQQLLNAGWDKLIDYTFANNRGVCYYLAAALDFVFQRAGFETRVVYAWHNSHHYWVQVKIDGVWWNYDPTYRYQRSHLTLAQQNQADINNGGPGYTLRGYVHAKYDHRGNLISATYEPI